MGFSKRKITKQSSLSRTLLNRKKDFGKKKDTKKSIFWSIIGYSLVGLFFFGVIVSYVVYQKYLTDLPDVTELENLQVSQSSILYDREGGEMYRIFDENRTYVTFDEISPYIINALVAGEDKRFWENQGVDPLGLIRAITQWITGQRSSLGGTSTLTQQLVRNTIIENRSSGESFSDGVARKIREIYLSFQITSRLSKEKIIELYLNKLGFGSNAHGVEQAAQTFFGKSALEVTILEASMLASLPKGPSYYSPYNNYNRLVGYPFIYNKEEGIDSKTRIATRGAQEENSEIFSKLTTFLEGLDGERISETRLYLCGLERDIVDSRFSVDNDGCTILSYSDLLAFLNTLRIESSDTMLGYSIGRKDFILGRMLEDNHINFQEYRESLLDSFGFQFKEYRENIKYPHFVFYIREYLEEKYGNDILEKGGLRIHTSIDPVAQAKAEEIIKKQADLNTSRFGVNNAALITLDNRTGEIIAMVGGRDYFNETIQGNVNMITSQLQPGSSFKSFVYGLAIDKEIIGSKTPIYDVETTFPGGYTPKNFDGTFLGKMDITTALNYSRNIPAIKMYYLAGGERPVIEWMEKLGVTSLTDFKEEYLKTHERSYEFGAPLALGTGLMTPLELAQAYSVFGSLGKSHTPVPILKIVDSQGLVIEEFDPNSSGTQVIDDSTAYIMNRILSDSSTRPTFWNNFLTLSGRPAAVKTGTSSMQYTQGGRQVILPRNLWTAGYTPQYTTVVWSGNTNGAAAAQRANGLEASGPIWKEFMEYLHSDEPSLDWRRPEGVKEVNISEITGMLAPQDMDERFNIRSIFKNVPQMTESGIGLREVDLLCNGLVTPETPESAVGTTQVVLLRSLRPNDPAWEQPVQEWVRSGGFDERLGEIGNFVTSLSNEVCVRTGIASDIEIGSSIKDGDILVSGSNAIEVGYRSANPLRFLRIFIDGERIFESDISGETRGIYNGSINVPRSIAGEAILRIEAIDQEFFSESISYTVVAGVRDITPPEIEFTNPANGRITLYPGEFFNLRGNVRDQSRIRSINIYLNDERLRIGLTGNSFVQEVQTTGLEAGIHIIKVEAVDGAFNTGTNTVELEIIPR
ncbi:transglycosylase domain-containing protein [Candidatus Gracilibacteria bacterium]|nr:transglycosylase domain-containing protein [Candidatus Gracilibacteria bacterium]